MCPAARVAPSCAAPGHTDQHCRCNLPPPLSSPTVGLELGAANPTDLGSSKDNHCRDITELVTTWGLDKGVTDVAVIAMGRQFLIRQWPSCPSTPNGAV